MTSSNTNLAGPNAIFLNVILAIIAFILIIYLRNMYVTIIAVVVVVGVYLVFDKNSMFALDGYTEAPYIETQKLDAMATSLPSSEETTLQNEYEGQFEEEEMEEVDPNPSGCSDIDFSDPNLVQIRTKDDLINSKISAADSSATLVLMDNIDLGGMVIEGSFYKTFNASFDGNCKIIFNFVISGASSANVGFFGYVQGKTPLYIKNVAFMMFGFQITSTVAENVGLFAVVNSGTSETPEDITLENIIVHLNSPSLLTFRPNKGRLNVGVFTGVCYRAKMLDCNVIISNKYDIYVESVSVRDLSMGMLCGWAGNVSMMACSVNMIGSKFIMQFPVSPRFGAICGLAAYNKDDSYLNLFNNIVLLKDASIKSNLSLNDYGYLLGSFLNNISVSAKNNSVFSFTSRLFESGDKLSASLSEFKVNENNKIQQYGSARPEDISIEDQIYGMTIDSGSLEQHINKEDPDNKDVYWKKTYYVYYEGDTSGMGCRYYDVFNFWMNSQVGTYCDTANMCNTNSYGTCDAGSLGRGWNQLTGYVSVSCDLDGRRTYTLNSDIRLSSAFTPIVLKDGDTFNGNNKVIICSSEWYGLFTFSEMNGNISADIENVYVNLNGNSIAEEQGAIIGSSILDSNTSKYAKYSINIRSCGVSNGSISARAGGIVGQGFCSNNISSISNCRNSCSISGDYAGGIVGGNSGKGMLTIESCYNTGMHEGTGCGGIIGYNCGSNDSNSYLLIFNCYNKGDLNNSSGGICAPSMSNGNNVMILNCYTNSSIPEGTISGENGKFGPSDLESDTWGGIVAGYATNSVFKPFVLNCDTYYQYTFYLPVNYDEEYLVSKISRNGYNQTQIDTGNISNSVNSFTVLSDNSPKLHMELFNKVKITQLISSIRSEYLSPSWTSDSLLPQNLER